MYAAAVIRLRVRWTSVAVSLLLLLPLLPAPAPLGAATSAAPSAVVQTRSSEPLRDTADAFLVEQDGGWFCPHNPDLESSAVCPADTNEGTDSRTFAEFLVEHIVANPQLTPPLYVRAGKARNDCSIAPGAACTTGVPAPAACLSPALPPAEYTVTTPFCALKGLRDVGARQVFQDPGAGGVGDGGALGRVRRRALDPHRGLGLHPGGAPAGSGRPPDAALRGRG